MSEDFIPARGDINYAGTGITQLYTHVDKTINLH